MRHRFFFITLFLAMIFSQALFSQANDTDQALSSFNRGLDAYSEGRHDEAQRSFARARAEAFDRHQISLLLEFARELQKVRRPANNRPTGREKSPPPSLYQEMMSCYNIIIDLADTYSKETIGDRQAITFKTLRDAANDLKTIGRYSESLAALGLADKLAANNNQRTAIAKRIKKIEQKTSANSEAASSSSAPESPPTSRTSPNSSRSASKTITPPNNSLGSFQRALRAPDEYAYRIGKWEPFQLNNRAQRLAVDLDEYPAAADQALADFAAITAVVPSYIFQGFQTEIIHSATSHLIELRRFIARAAEAGDCGSLNMGNVDSLREEIDAELTRLAQEMDSAMERFEADRMAVFIDSTLDTAQPSEGEPPSPPPQRTRENGNDIPLTEEELFALHINHLRWQPLPEVGRLFGEHAAPNRSNLTQQVRRALRQARGRQSRSATPREQLAFNTRRMQVLAGALLQVTVLQRSRAHAQRLEGFQRRITGFATEIGQCVDHFEAQVNRLPLNNPQQIISELQRIREEFVPRLSSSPPVLRGLEQRSAPRAGWSTTSQVLRQMAAELRIQLAIRRTGWCQAKQQAALAATMELR